ncbi:MAG: hypothetical protein INF00_13115, partial [Phenylobacterium sp.]|nr:hypothetical protein [Phenylobacterium sp.]
ASAPAYALGGVNDATAGRLRMTGAAGIAGVGFSLTAPAAGRTGDLRT